MRHSNVESYRSLCHYGYVSKQNVNPQMSSWVHPTFGPFEMGSRNFKTHFCVGNTIYQYLVCINMLYHLENKPYAVQKHDLRMFSYRSCYPFQSSHPSTSHLENSLLHLPGLSLSSILLHLPLQSTPHRVDILWASYGSSYWLHEWHDRPYMFWYTKYMYSHTHISYLYIIIFRHSDIHVSCIHNEWTEVVGECNLEAPTW